VARAACCPWSAETETETEAESETESESETEAETESETETETETETEAETENETAPKGRVPWRACHAMLLPGPGGSLPPSRVSG